MIERTEVALKLLNLRDAMKMEGLDGIRFRGVDWFSWVTGGANPVVILTSETGIAEVFVTRESAYVLTNHIEAQRLTEEEVSKDFEVIDRPWTEGASAFDRFIFETVNPAVIASDRPLKTERSLPQKIEALKLVFAGHELDRYRALGRDAGLAMKAALSRAEPGMTELQLAGEGAKEMWAMGIHPTLTLVAGEARLLTRRHPFPTKEKLGRRAMMVFCARRGGLYANFTRFVYFRKPSSQEQKYHDDLMPIEAAVLNASKPGASLQDGFDALARAYEHSGYPDELKKHHQGGSTGYLSRERVAGISNTPLGANDTIREGSTLAWNPSLPGAKMEDTFLVTKKSLENLTDIDGWPSVMVDGRKRPSIWIKD